MKRTQLEYFFRKITDKFNINFRFHNYGSGVWNFEWWKRIPGNPLNKRCILDYNVGWPIPRGSYQPGKIRKKYLATHQPPYSRDELEYLSTHQPPYNGDELERSTCYEIQLKVKRNATKDDVIFATLSHSTFINYLGLPGKVDSFEQLKIMLDLIGVKYE